LTLDGPALLDETTMIVSQTISSWVKLGILRADLQIATPLLGIGKISNNSEFITDTVLQTYYDEQLPLGVIDYWQDIRSTLDV
jgi:hypothetical protein